MPRTSKSIGGEVLRGSLSFVFVAAAILKILHAPEPTGALGGQASEITRWSLLGLDLVIGLGLWTRYARHCCVGAMCVAMVGVGLSAYSAATGQSISCGCLGTAELNRLPHVALSTVIFLLALRVNGLKPNPAERTTAAI